jgi:hypothetical protein
MNRRALAKTVASVALIVLSTGSGASDCERRNGLRQDQDGTHRSGEQVVVKADDDVCWRVTVDDRTRSGCGDAKFYRYKKDRDAEVERVDNGKKDGTKDKKYVDVALIVDGKTVYHEKIRATDHSVRVDDGSRSSKKKHSSSDNDDA